MNTKFSLFVVMLLTAFSLQTAFSQSGLSDAYLYNTGNGRDLTMTDPYTNQSRNFNTRIILGTVDGDTTKFYCVDINRTLSFPDQCHKDSAVTDPKIVYILNNYQPYNPNPVDELSNLNDEVAATQVAIWHFSDGVNANTITNNNTVRGRALEIITDANLNGVATNVVTTMSINSGASSDDFYVRTLDQNGNPIAVNNIQLAISLGSLSTNIVNTLASGNSPDVTVFNTSTGIITATAMAVIPQGITYACPGKQRLVLALPAIGEKQVTSDWGALPVELTSFVAASNGRDVVLNWSTSSESNNSRFEIERLGSQSGTNVNSEWSNVGSVAGVGTSTVSNNYSFTDTNLATGVYNYRLKQIDFNGNFEYFNLSNEVEVGTPSKFDLSQNYPNPFNPSTKINFSMAKEGNVSIKVFDNTGKQVATLLNEFRSSGFYTIDFNAANLTSGIYFYKMETSGVTKVMKMTLIK
ncbi:MAG: Cys-Gln thioester bond-forming surface protein [Ignavibacteria bacterium]|nr:Cys-Gln thioester bond-forming surface protein [Ignavibacteria bacterium]